jgi:hypothetical protein
MTTPAGVSGLQRASGRGWGGSGVQSSLPGSSSSICATSMATSGVSITPMRSPSRFFMPSQTGTPSPASLGVVQIGPEDFQVAAPAGRLDNDRPQLSDLADLDWIISGPETYYGRAMRTACARAGFEPSVRHQVNEQATALAMVASGLGIALMSELGGTFMPNGVETHPPETRAATPPVDRAQPTSLGRPAIRGVHRHCSSRAEDPGARYLARADGLGAQTAPLRDPAAIPEVPNALNVPVFSPANTQKGECKAARPTPSRHHRSLPRSRANAPVLLTLPVSSDPLLTAGCERYSKVAIVLLARGQPN